MCAPSAKVKRRRRGELDYGDKSIDPVERRRSEDPFAYRLSLRRSHPLISAMTSARYVTRGRCKVAVIADSHFRATPSPLINWRPPDAPSYYANCRGAVNTLQRSQVATRRRGTLAAFFIFTLLVQSQIRHHVVHRFVEHREIRQKKLETFKGKNGDDRRKTDERKNVSSPSTKINSGGGGAGVPRRRRTS
uniref:Uncharacterized protein n=1 Tax=Steinernema glaseri TaxID=37863 RepID=A0A1I7Z5M8_9BILA